MWCAARPRHIPSDGSPLRLPLRAATDPQLEKGHPKASNSCSSAMSHPPVETVPLVLGIPAVARSANEAEVRKAHHPRVDRNVREDLQPSPIRKLERRITGHSWRLGGYRYNRQATKVQYQVRCLDSTITEFENITLQDSPSRDRAEGPPIAHQTQGQAWLNPVGFLDDQRKHWSKFSPEFFDHGFRMSFTIQISYSSEVTPQTFRPAVSVATNSGFP